MEANFVKPILKPSQTIGRRGTKWITQFLYRDQTIKKKLLGHDKSSCPDNKIVKQNIFAS